MYLSCLRGVCYVTWLPQNFRTLHAKAIVLLQLLLSKLPNSRAVAASLRHRFGQEIRHCGLRTIKCTGR